MVGTLVIELSDGEELVVEGVPVRVAREDPRDRAFEVRRLAVSPLDPDDPWKVSRDSPCAEMRRE